MKVLKVFLVLLFIIRASKSNQWANYNLKIGIPETWQQETKNTTLRDFEIFLYKPIFLDWTKILPEVFTSKLNLTEVKRYYAKLDRLLQRGVEPVVSIVSGPVPKNFDYLGGWTNPILVQYFSNYARQVFKIFGSRVRKWCTFYNPIKICRRYKGLGNAEFLCGHNILIAHAEAYHIYDKEFRVTQNGEIAINFDISHYNKNLETLQFQFEYFANPLLNFDYPTSVVNKIYAQSIEEGLGKSLLPEFSYFEKNKISGTLDHLQLTSEKNYESLKNSNYFNTRNKSHDEFKEFLNWIRKTYHNPRLVFLEINPKILELK